MAKTTPLKILHYNTASGWRGGEQQVLYLVQGLADFPVIQFAAGQPNENFLQQISGHVECCFPLKSRAEFNPSAVIKLIDIIKQNKIDIVHSHSTPAQAMALQAKLFYHNFKLIVHRRVDFRVKNNVFSLFKYRSKKVDRIIAISQFIKNLLISQTIPESKIVVIYSGVDPKRFQVDPTKKSLSLRDEYNISEKTIILGNIAALTGHKDHLTLVKSMTYLREKGIDFKLFILGQGEQRANIIKEINKADLNESIVLTGFRSDVHNFLGQFDIVVHSSSDEGLGTSIIDALANSIPVAATNAGGIPEILGNDRFGLVVPKQNPFALGQAVIKLIEDTELRKKYENLGPQRANDFSVSNMVEKTYILYREVMDSV